MPKVPGIGKKSGGGDIDVDALADQQSALVKNMTAALANIMTSQIKFAEALGKKNLADGLTKPLDRKTRKRLDLELEVIKKHILSSFRGHVSSK